MYMNVWMSVGRSMCVYRLWECVSEVYVFQYAFPSGKTYLCIYSIYIVSVSFAYNMQTATWWSDSTEVHLKDSRGERHVCMGGIEPDSSTYIPLLWLVRWCSKKRNTEVRFYDTFHHVDAVPISTAHSALYLLHFLYHATPGIHNVGVK